MFLSPKIWGCKYTNNFLFINKKAVFQHFGVLITSAASDRFLLLFFLLLLFSFSFLFPFTPTLSLPSLYHLPPSYPFLHIPFSIPFSSYPFPSSSFILLYSVTPSVPVVAHPPDPPYTTHPRTDIIRIISIRPTPY